MKLRLLSLFAAVALVAACESSSDQNAAQTGGGQSTTKSVSNTSNSIVPGSAEDFKATVGQDRVFFDFDKYAVRADARPILEKWASWMTKYPAAPVLIEGHADERGTREYNLALGERRANSIKEFLSSKGVAAARIKVVSYGKERPAVQGNNDAAWSQNRRGEGKIAAGPTS
ncbi:MAG: peptidoglycan-associated lipoprotein Pal [Alphaproteobacteria bacterium]